MPLVARWGDEKGFGRLVEWVEDHVEETLTVYRLPREHRPADEVHEHAGAVQRGAPSAHACRPDLPERGVLSASDLGTCGGDP